MKRSEKCVLSQLLFEQFGHEIQDLPETQRMLMKLLLMTIVTLKDDEAAHGLLHITRVVRKIPPGDDIVTVVSAVIDAYPHDPAYQDAQTYFFHLWRIVIAHPSSPKTAEETIVSPDPLAQFFQHL